VYLVFVRACSILTSTAAIVAPFSPLTGSILRPYNSPQQTFPFRLTLMCFHKRLETQMFALCFLLSSATQEMLPYLVTYFLRQITVICGSTKITFYSNFKLHELLSKTAQYFSVYFAYSIFMIIFTHLYTHNE
jgi:hypothetical protein